MDGNEWRQIAEQQAGAIARSQLLALGLTARQARCRLDTGRWQQIHPGVYLTFTGPVGDLARVWAAVLAAGSGAAAGYRTALWLFGALTTMPERLEICIPQNRQVRSMPGVRVYRKRQLERHVHPVALPPRVRLETAVLDVADREASDERAIDVVLRVIQQRLTTADRLAQQLGRRLRHRWRSLLLDVLSEAADGVTTILELRYARDVERVHGLPKALRNRPEGEQGAQRYHDARYEKYATVVELDGREAHPLEEAFRDMRRDNVARRNGDLVLRFGWRDVAGHPCEVAAQVAKELTARGWTGRPYPCGPACSLDLSG